MYEEMHTETSVRENDFKNSAYIHFQYRREKNIKQNGFYFFRDQ